MSVLQYHGLHYSVKRHDLQHIWVVKVDWSHQWHIIVLEAVLLFNHFITAIRIQTLKVEEAYLRSIKCAQSWALYHLLHKGRTYICISWVRLKWKYAISRLTANFVGGLMSYLVNCKFRKVWSYMTPNVLTETRCHYTTQIKPDICTY